MTLTRALFLNDIPVSARRTGVAVLSTVLAAAGLALVPATPAMATKGGGSSAPSFVCTANTVYSIDGSKPHTISKINPTTGSASSNGSILPSDDVAINALALPAGGGRYIYAFNRNENEIVRFDATTQDEDEWNAPSNESAGAVIAGAINPANGLYYYASGGSPWKLFAFNTNTNAAVGQVGTISGLEGNGDMAFDAAGNLYVVSNGGDDDAGTLARINAPLPSSVGSTGLSGTHLATLPDDSGRYAAMAFDGNGELVIGTTAGKVLRVNPASGATIATKTVADLVLADMASCASPSTASARVNLPSGRYDGDDQFKTTITGGGVTSGNSGTTAGTDTGLQTQTAEVAGPVVVLPGGTYTITQTGTAGTNLADYVTTWKCESGATTVASGNGSSGSFTVPSSSGSNVVCTFTNLPLFPAIELDKTGSSITDLDGNGPDAGDKITYSFKVTNTGNVALSTVGVTDTKVGAITCPSTTLAVGASMTCTPKDYVVTQAEVTAGKVDNTATAKGKSPSGNEVTDPDSVSTPVPATPGIELDKTAGTLVDSSAPGGPSAGDTITYSFKVTNTGNVPLHPVTVSDPKVGAVTCPTTELAPGAGFSCTPKVYTLVQADVNAAKVENTATATGKPPTGADVTDSDSTTTLLQAAAAIELDKTGSAIADLDGNGADAGDTITYSFKVTNTGNVTLNPVTVTDTKVGAVTCPSGALAPAASATCTPKSYTLTQAEVTSGKVDNTATAEGTPPSGPKVSDIDAVTTPVPSLPTITLVKTAGALADGDGNGPDAGDTISYSFKVTNTGNVPLSPVTVSDPKVGPVTCPTGALAPDAHVTCTAAAYALTQADVDLGRVDNTAVAQGRAPNGVEVTDDDSTTTPVAGEPQIRLDKTGSAINDLNGNGNDAGDTITYSFEVTNTGSVTLTDITVSDPKVGPVTCPGGSLAPGESVDCEPRLYAITQADVNAGSFDNTATAEGTAPDGEVVEDDDTHHVDLPATASIAIDKVAGSLVDGDGNGPDAGDTITFSFTVFNTGNLPLTAVAVSDPKAGPVTCPQTALEPDESMVCTDVVYVVTASDLAAGSVDNTATVTGTPPSGPKVTDDDSTTTPVEATTTNIKVTKDVDSANPRVGDTITYTLTVTNNGDATADNVVVTDHLPNGVSFVSAQAPCSRSGSTVTCEIGSLAAGDSESLEIKVKVDPLPQVNTEHQHWIDVQKTEVHVDLEPGGTRSSSVECMPGYYVTDGSGRIDHVDQDTGTFADVVMTENRAAGTTGWQATFVNDASGRAQAKIFAVCLKKESETVSGHEHGPVIGDLVTETHALPQGRTEVTLACAPGHTPVQPGYELDGVATVLTTYPSGDNAWTWVVDNGDAGEGTFTMRCLDDLVSAANGHTHGLTFSEVRQTGTVPAGQSKEFTLTCAGDAKGIVAGYDMDPGLVTQGNDPRPIIRVFKFYNPTNGPLDVRMFLLCLGNRTGGGADGGGTIINTASATTTSHETTTADNSDTAKVVVNTSPPVTIVAKAVTVTAKAVTAPVQCKKGKKSCTGVAVLVALEQGTVLAKTSFKVKAGKKVVLKLKKTAAGKKALRSLKKAKLQVGGKTRTVSIRR